MRTFANFLLHATVVACGLPLAALSRPANAQVVLDLTMITCGQYMEQDRDKKDVLAAWMSGYFNAARNQSMVDLARFDRNRKAVEKYCKNHKPETLMSAIQRNAY
jgi:acid stress chaperone HdeB